MATWCESLTDQKRFYLPRDIGSRRAMRLVNIIAALLDENECDAPALAEAICNEIKASIAPESEYKPGRYQIAAPAKLHEFVERFLYGSTEASALLLGILTKEVFGKDWIESDHADASRTVTRATANGSDETSRLDREITRLRKVISNNSNQIERNLQLYTFGEVDEAWIKEHNGPLRRRSEDAQKELETVLSQRESTRNIEEMREDLQEVCTRISEKLDSADDQQKKLILDALQVEVTVTGQKVNLGLELGVAPEVSRLTTTGRTSASRRVYSLQSRWV